MVGNKIDEERHREVDSADAKQYANANSLYFIETSPKTNINIRKLFTDISKQLPKVSFYIYYEMEI